MNGLEADYDILLRHFLLYQTSLKINVADPVKEGWNIFHLLRQMKIYTSVLLALIQRYRYYPLLRYQQIYQVS